jgi:hypothetical protein
MEDYHWAVITLMVIWIVGVISFGVWLFKKAIPNIHKMLDASNLTDIQKQQLLSKTMFPPRFRK